MTNTIKEAAENYESKKMANIADLENFDISETMEERKGINNDGKKYTYNVLIRDGKEYRIPDTILDSLKGILKANTKHDKKVTTFSVEKTGDGMGTKYQVVTLK